MAKIKVSDYIASRLHQAGIADVFLVPGGGAMHLDDSFCSHPALRCLFFHHEQACAIAADAYYRLHNRLPLVSVTSGPGGTNAITGVYGAWVDSIGMLIISGQVKTITTLSSTTLPLRQVGDQELNIIDVVRPITKYAAMILDPAQVRYHVEKALHLAVSGRPGPVWLDVPLDIQAAFVDPDTLVGYDPAEDAVTYAANLDVCCPEILDRIARAKRPVILAGTGVWLSGMHERFLALADKLQIPVTTAWNSNDLLANDSPWYCGRPGTIGDRAGNFTVQNADLLVILGSRLNIRMVSYNWPAFARHAAIIAVDIDQAEMDKATLHVDYKVHAPLQDFLPKILGYEYSPNPDHAAWLRWCHERQKNYPVVLAEYWKTQRVNNYCFVETLFDALPENAVVVTGNGSACVVTFQAAVIKKGQRVFHNSGCATMGFDLPGAIGACIATGREDIVCIAGDGSIQMNLQELQTISGNKLPIKLFVLNNNGYLSIKQTQSNFFKGRYYGCSPDSGLTFPSFERLAYAYDIPYHAIVSHDGMDRTIQKVLAAPGPQLVEVFLDLEQSFAPKLVSRQLESGVIVSPPPEDMFPFLSREELQENMFYPIGDTQ